MAHNQRLRLGLLLFVLALGVPALLFDIFTGGNPFTIGGLVLTLISCALGMFQLTREGEAVRSNSSNGRVALGKRHLWLYTSAAIGLALLPAVFFALRLGLGVERPIALAVATAVALIVAGSLSILGVRATR